MGDPREPSKRGEQPDIMDPHVYRLSVDDLPDAPTQAGIIKYLAADKTDTNMYGYKYAVSVKWYKAWQKYLGANPEVPRAGVTAPPGPVPMDCEDDRNNIYIEGFIWRQLMSWYGCSIDHELDREECCSRIYPKCLEVGFLNSLLGRVKHRRKCFNMEEYTGYVELQLRRHLQVPVNSDTRLWVAEKGSECQPLFDRTVELQSAFKPEGGKTYMLALEVKEPNGCWPSGLMLPSTGSLLKFNDITQGYVPSIDSTLKISIQNIADNCNTQMVDIVESMVSGHKKSLDLQRKQCQKLFEETKETYNIYKSSKEEYQAKLKELNEEKVKFQKEKEAFEKVRNNFNAELRQMEDLNKITESVVKLNIGGHVFQTSIATLTSDPDSMLALMFSGRYPLSRLADGSYFLDRDGKLFSYILMCLRNGSLEPEHLPRDEETLWALYYEADYYQLRGMPNGKDLNIFNFADEFFEERVSIIEAFQFTDDFFSDNEDE